MAYTLSDHLRPLRLALRVNGLLVGLAPGVGFLTLSSTTLTNWGLHESGAIWPLRLAGAALIGLGLIFLLVASHDTIGLVLLSSASVTNTLFALVLLIAYFQGEFERLNGIGRVLLVVYFALCLVGALAPLPYLRAEYRD